MSTLLRHLALVSFEDVYITQLAVQVPYQKVKRNSSPPSLSSFTRIIFIHSLSLSLSLYIVTLHVISSITDMHTQVYIRMGCPSHTWLIHGEQDQIKSQHPIWVIPLYSSPEVMLESTTNLWLEKKERDSALAPLNQMLAALPYWDGRRLFLLMQIQARSPHTSIGATSLWQARENWKRGNVTPCPGPWPDQEKVAAFLDRHGFSDVNQPRDNGLYQRISVEQLRPLQVADMCARRDGGEEMEPWRKWTYWIWGDDVKMVHPSIGATILYDRKPYEPASMFRPFLCLKMSNFSGPPGTLRIQKHK